ncbi:MAG: hypothetical protein QOD84_538 [Acidobacteriaceae bacterium]|jgi:isopenicillin-N epimerase
MLSRRDFLAHGGRLATLLGFQPAALAQAPESPALPSSDLYASHEDVYWAEVRKQFLIPEDEIYLNNGTVGSSPRPVLRAVFDSYEESEKLAQANPEAYPIWGYDARNDIRDPLAAFVGASRDEIALLRNATEANTFIANGIDLKAGDEVLISDQEHPGGEEPWNLRAKRYGIIVKKFSLSKPAKDATEILTRISDAITARTRVIFVSHITTVTGLVMPVKQICSLARAKGIISALDGAQVTGMMRLNLHDIGCDFYSSSPHKWLQAPKGTGYLYIRDEMIDRVWNTCANEGWDNPHLRAERFQRLGTCNLPVLAGLRASLEFANNIGMERIEKRQRALADYVLSEMLKRGVESWTSPDPALRCAIATFNIPPIKCMEFEAWLWKNHKIRIRGDVHSKVRISTPYYLAKAGIDNFFERFDEYRELPNRGDY